MTRNTAILLAAGGSLAALLGAFAFQYIGDMAPCKLCYWQRYPHAAAIAIGVAALLVSGRLLPWLGALAAATTGGIGAYHAGVERKWWAGPESCTGDGTALSGLSGADLLSTETADVIVRCDEIPWEMLGISMAGWNAVFSFVLVGLWLYAARRAF